MSGLERWWQEAKERFETLRARWSRWVPAPVSREQLTAEDAAVRWRAVRALVGRPHANLLPRVVDLAGDEDAMVRAAAVDALVSWGPAVVLEHVHTTLKAPPSRESTISLLEVLARLPDPANREAIQPWLDVEDEGVRAAAWMALAALCDDDDLPRLGRALKEGGLPMQRAIMTTLCAPHATDLARRAAEASDPVLRQRGQQALARIQRNQPVAEEGEVAS